jgi:hypothetical protein
VEARQVSKDDAKTMTIDKSGLAKASSVATAQMPKMFPWAERGVIVHVGVDPLKGSPHTPAWHTPATGDIRINLDVVFKSNAAQIEADAKALGRVDSDGLRSGDAKTVYGLLAHEASHSRWSDWMQEAHDRKINPIVSQIMVLFEELRIEKRAADKGASDHLRWSFRWLLRSLADAGEMDTSPMGLAHTWALTMGRFTASIASRDEVAPIDEVARASLGDQVVDVLQEILDEAVSYDSRRPERVVTTLERLAREWLDALDVDPDEMMKQMTEAMSCILHDGDRTGGDEKGLGGGKGDEDGDGEGSGTGTGGSGEGDETKGRSGAVGGDKKVDFGGGGDGSSHDEADSVDAGEVTGADPRGYDPDMVELIKRAADEVAESMTKPMTMTDSIDMSDPMDMAGKVFGKRTRTESSWTLTDPTPQNRAHAASLARTFEQLALPSVTKLHIPSDLPPGRLRGREAVRRSAEKAQGLLTTATPWEMTKRKRSTSRPVIVGTMTDVSGSMSWAEQFVADFSWTVSTAGTRCGARSAAVTFGNTVEYVTAPGEIPNKIARRSADGGTEMFDMAAAALDGVLHFTSAANSAKVLFIVSDGDLVNHGEPSRAMKWIERFTAAGTYVVWLGCNPGRWSDYAAHAKVPGRLSRIDVRGGDYGRGGSDLSKVMKEMENIIVAESRGVGVAWGS